MSLSEALESNGKREHQLSSTSLIIRTKIDTNCNEIEENWGNFAEEYIDISSISKDGLNILKDKLVSFLSA